MYFGISAFWKFVAVDNITKINIFWTQLQYVEMWNEKSAPKFNFKSRNLKLIMLENTKRIKLINPDNDKTNSNTCQSLNLTFCNLLWQWVNLLFTF